MIAVNRPFSVAIRLTAISTGSRRPPLVRADALDDPVVSASNETCGSRRRSGTSSVSGCRRGRVRPVEQPRGGRVGGAYLAVRRLRSTMQSVDESTTLLSRGVASLQAHRVGERAPGLLIERADRGGDERRGEHQGERHDFEDHALCGVLVQSARPRARRRPLRRIRGCGASRVCRTARRNRRSRPRARAGTATSAKS